MIRLVMYSRKANGNEHTGTPLLHLCFQRKVSALHLMEDGALEVWCIFHDHKRTENRQFFVGPFHEQIAALKTRLRSSGEDVRAARREALLEGEAKSLTEVEAAREKASKAYDKAGALRDRCIQQVRRGEVFQCEKKKITFHGIYLPLRP